MQLHEKIRWWREAKHYKQLFVANKLGIGQQAYSKIEQGKTKPSDEAKRKLAEILEVPLSKFYIEDDEENYNTIPPEKEKEYLKKIIDLQEKDISHLEMLVGLLKNGRK